MKSIKNRNSGFTLIELMIAMVIGLIVLFGLVTLFTSSSTLNRAQSGLAVLQENGRYAITRIKQDIELAGRKHCATVSMPSQFVTNWDQGYSMNAWQVDSSVVFDNGFPIPAEAAIDGPDDDQLTGSATDANFVLGNSYPLDPSYFIRGYECDATSCTPALTTLGSDALTTFPAMGVANGSRAANADVLTVRYLQGGTRVIASSPGSVTLAESVDSSTSEALIADCGNSIVKNATWSGDTVSVSGPAAMPEFNLTGDTRAYALDTDLKNVSYFLGIDTDPSDSDRMISSLYRSENGNTQQIVEGVERLDVFYLAQLQTGHVARLTANEVQQISGGGIDADANGGLDTRDACILPPVTPYFSSNYSLANDQGCLWRSIYAIEIHLLLNTVNNSATNSTESFIYSPDGNARQTPGTTLPSGLDPERMYRREFTAIVPVRSYTL